MKIGIVSAIDPAVCAARVQFPDNDGVVSFWLPVVQPKSLKDRFYHMPDVGEHVVCLLDENGESGVILGAIYSQSDAPPVNSVDKWHVTFEDGTILEYDRAVHKLFADVKGDIDVTASGNITSTAPLWTHNGKLVVTEDIESGADIKAAGDVADQGGAKTMAGMRTAYNGHHHATSPTPDQGM